MKKLLAATLFLLVPFLASAQFGQNKIVYDKFEWSVYRSTHFQIYFYASEKGSLETVASLSESAYDELSRELNYQIGHPIPLIFYATHADFEQTNTDPDFISEGIGAFALPSRDRMVLPVDEPDAELQKLIQHELTHVFEFNILFGGNFIKAYRSSIPQWFMEGLASYYGHDEDNRARMVLRDMVMADMIPEISKNQVGGYFAYRFGHAVFDFMTSEWGPTAVRDFVYEWRNNISANTGKVVKRAFDIEPDEFDVRFRRYLRKRYMDVLATKGEPVDFGQRFKLGEDPSWDLSPAPYPSGDLVAAISTYGSEDIGIVTLSAADRKFYKRLTKRYTTRYEYVICPAVTTRPDPGRALSVSPDGNRIAAFVRRERGRNLALFNALSGTLEREIPLPGIDSALSPSFSPDGGSIIFAALAGGKSAIYRYTFDSGRLVKLTDDDAYNMAPTFSPDGKWIYYSSVAESFAKIFRMDANDPSRREQITFGDWNDEDASVSPDGARLYLSSDRDRGIYNIYGIDLATGDTYQYTDVMGGAFTPSVLPQKGGTERLIFAGYHKRKYSIYVAETGSPFRKLAEKNPPPVIQTSKTVARFVPAVEVALDKDKLQKNPSRKLYIDSVSATVGVNSDSTLFSNTTLIFSDNLGDRRFFLNLQSISTYTDFHLAYFNIGRRLQYGAMIYDTREYFLGINQSNGRLQRDRRFLRETGAVLLGGYPLDRYRRLEGSIGYLSRSLDSPFYFQNADGTKTVTFLPRTDSDPVVGLTFTSDTTLYSEIGPLQGSRYSASVSYMPDLRHGDEIIGHQADGTPVISKHGGTVTFDTSLDLRHYFRITRRSLVAVRLFGARSRGNFPSIFSFGGYDSLRAYDFREEIGNEVAYGNFEYRFPLIDAVQLPFGVLQNIRGRAFVDVGAANFSNSGQPFRFWNASTHELVDGRADYGAGFTVSLMGLDLNWDFARQWNFRKSLSTFRTAFYIGAQF